MMPHERVTEADREYMIDELQLRFWLADSYEQRKAIAAQLKLLREGQAMAERKAA